MTAPAVSIFFVSHILITYPNLHKHCNSHSCVLMCAGLTFINNMNSFFYTRQCLMYCVHFLQQWDQSVTNFKSIWGLLFFLMLCYSEESVLCPLPHTWAHRHLWLASFTVIDKGERIYPSQPDSSLAQSPLALYSHLTQYCPGRRGLNHQTIKSIPYSII